MKTKHDNDVIDLIGVVYAKKQYWLSWPIKSAIVCDENQIW